MNSGNQCKKQREKIEEKWAMGPIKHTSKHRNNLKKQGEKEEEEENTCRHDWSLTKSDGKH